jgi:ABC-type histidine transport system ATPase subunit
VKPEEIVSLQFHQQLFLLPHVLITHRAIDGAVQILQELNAEGKTLQYFTVRQNFDKEVCQQVHRNTCVWLEKQHFPCPMDVRFFWDAGDKLIASLEAPEEEVFLIDDRPVGLLKAYEKISQCDAHKAQQIRQRLTLVAFGCTEELQGLPSSDLRVVPLENWSAFRF